MGQFETCTAAGLWSANLLNPTNFSIGGCDAWSWDGDRVAFSGSGEAAATDVVSPNWGFSMNEVRITVTTTSTGLLEIGGVEVVVATPGTYSATFGIDPANYIPVSAIWRTGGVSGYIDSVEVIYVSATCHLKTPLFDLVGSSTDTLWYQNSWNSAYLGWAAPAGWGFSGGGLNYGQTQQIGTAQNVCNEGLSGPITSNITVEFTCVDGTKATSFTVSAQWGMMSSSVVVPHTAGTMTAVIPWNFPSGPVTETGKLLVGISIAGYGAGTDITEVRISSINVA